MACSTINVTKICKYLFRCPCFYPKQVTMVILNYYQKGEIKICSYFRGTELQITPTSNPGFQNIVKSIYLFLCAVYTGIFFLIKLAVNCPWQCSFTILILYQCNRTYSRTEPVKIWKAAQLWQQELLYYYPQNLWRSLWMCCASKKPQVFPSLAAHLVIMSAGHSLLLITLSSSTR